MPAHRAKKTSDKLKDADWEMMAHPSYSPDIGSSDYHLFSAFLHAIGDTEFENDVKLLLNKSIDSKPRDFRMKDFQTMSERW